jgi:hypothetical protein
VVLRQPAPSELDLAVTARVPGDVSEINQDTTSRTRQSGITAPLVLMDGGWVLGGALAYQQMLAWRKAREIRKAAAQ